jgi:UPF0755 protein
MKPLHKRFIAAGALVIVGIAGAFVLLPSPATEYPEGSARAPVKISVSSGENGSSIAADLERNGVILKSSSFIKLAMSDPRSLSISPGLHTIDSHITSKQALTQLLDPSRNSGLIRVIEGSTLADILSTFKANEISGPTGNLSIPSEFGAHQSVEGFLFPATYSFAQGTTRNQALQEMIKNFFNRISSTSILSGYGKYSPYQILTIASLIQIEADAADYGKAAKVIYNRLKINMPLQLNSTVQYALNTRGRIALSAKQTRIASPFNTYLNTGLPPTPISNPGLEAINAALHPVAGDWLYFITIKPHDTRFTKSFEEFQSWVTLYNNNLANGLFK